MLGRDFNGYLMVLINVGKRLLSFLAAVEDGMQREASLCVRH